MIALYILLGLALIICAILFLPYTVILEYDGDLNITHKASFIKLTPKGGALEKVVPALKQANSFLRGDKPSGKGGQKKGTRKQNVDEILEILSLSKLLLQSFFKHLRVRVARFNIKVATGDPATAAIAYGAVNGAVASLYALLEEKKNVKGLGSAQINVWCDFFSDTPDADIKLSFTLRVWQALSIILSSAISHAKNMVEKDKRR